MIRNFQVFGLTLMASLAATAFACSLTIAAEFTSASGVYPQHIVGTDIGAQNVTTVSGSELSCSEESYTGTATKATTVLTVTPSRLGCKTLSASFNNITVTHNGCTVDFSVTGEVKLVCPTGKVMEMHHYSTVANHTAGTASCTNTTGPQTAEGLVTYTNTGSGDILVHGSATGTVQTHGACSFGLTINVQTTYHYSDTVSATSGAAIHVK